MRFTALLVLILLLSCSESLMLLSWQQQMLSKNWSSLQYSEGAGALNVGSQIRIPKQTWIDIYKEYFFVPQWLAEEKFRECDGNGDGVISETETWCF